MIAIREMRQEDKDIVLQMKKKLAEYLKNLDKKIYAENQELGNVFVAEFDGKIVGFVEYSIKRQNR